MQRIRNVDEGMPGDWWYKQPETGAVIRGGDYYNLLKNIKEHRRGNHLPIGTNFVAEIQDAICERQEDLSRACVRYDPDTDPLAPRRRVTFDDAVQFLETMTRAVASGAPLVSAEEANRRARICVDCPKNIGIDGCVGCRGLLNWVAKAVGGRSTKFDGSLRGCEVCGCELKVAVHVNLEAQQKATPPAMRELFPSYCWKKEAGKISVDEPGDQV